MLSYKTSFTVSFVLTSGSLLAAPTVFAADSPVQSSASTVYNLDPIAPVQLAGSDQAAADFMNNDMPGLLSAVNATLSERQEVDNVADFALDPNPLVFTEESNARVYFLGEGAGYKNSFGFYTGPSDAGVTGSSDAALIFPDASTNPIYSSSSFSWFTDSGRRLSNEPLAPGDFVDIGTFEAGSQANLFLVANGANGGTNTWYSDPSLNSDGLVHYVALADPGSPYLLVGIEDLPGGGDKDYNDLVMAIDIGATNVQNMIEISGTSSGSTVSTPRLSRSGNSGSTVAAAPLPPSLWAALGALGITFRRRWRRRA